MKHLESAFKDQNGKKARNDWWTYLVVSIIVFIVMPLVGSIPLGIVMMVKGDPQSGFGQGQPVNFTNYGIDLNWGLFLQLLPFVLSFFALMVLVKPLHNRTFKEVINGRNQIRYSRILIGGAIWGLLLLFSLAYDYYLNIGNYEVRYNLSKLIILTFVSFLMLPFQTFFEEIFVRGYLAQGFGVLTRSRIVVIIMPSLIFALLHSANPEVFKHGFWLMMGNYFVVGFIYAIVTTLDDGVELAMGAHMANNFLLCVFVTSDSSVLQTNALLNDLENVTTYEDTLIMLLTGIVFIGILSFKYKWSFKQLFQKIEAPKELEV